MTGLPCLRFSSQRLRNFTLTKHLDLDIPRNSIYLHQRAFAAQILWTMAPLESESDPLVYAQGSKSALDLLGREDLFRELQKRRIRSSNHRCEIGDVGHSDFGSGPALAITGPFDPRRSKLAGCGSVQKLMLPV